MYCKKCKGSLLTRGTCRCDLNEEIVELKRANEELHRRIAELQKDDHQERPENER